MKILQLTVGKWIATYPITYNLQSLQFNYSSSLCSPISIKPSILVCQVQVPAVTLHNAIEFSQQTAAHKWYYPLWWETPASERLSHLPKAIQSLRGRATVPAIYLQSLSPNHSALTLPYKLLQASQKFLMTAARNTHLSPEITSSTMLANTRRENPFDVQKLKNLGIIPIRECPPSP